MASDKHIRLSPKAAEQLKDKVLAGKIMLAISKGLPAEVEHNGNKYIISSATDQK